MIWLEERKLKRQQQILNQWQWPWSRNNRNQILRFLASCWKLNFRGESCFKCWDKWWERAQLAVLCTAIDRRQNSVCCIFVARSHYRSQSFGLLLLLLWLTGRGNTVRLLSVLVGLLLAPLNKVGAVLIVALLKTTLMSAKSRIVSSVSSPTTTSLIVVLVERTSTATTIVDHPPGSVDNAKCFAVKFTFDLPVNTLVRTTKKNKMNTNISKISEFLPFFTF